MLVLSRKSNEAIRIADDICVRVVSVDGGVVKLGIEAPAHVSIHREEVYARIQEENRLAARDLPASLSSLAARWKEQKGRETGNGTCRS